MVIRLPGSLLDRIKPLVASPHSSNGRAYGAMSAFFERAALEYLESPITGWPLHSATPMRQTCFHLPDTLLARIRLSLYDPTSAYAIRYGALAEFFTLAAEQSLASLQEQ